MQMDNTNKSSVENRDDGTYVVKKTKKSSILAFVICVLVAFFIWAYAEATDKQEKEVNVPSDAEALCAELDGESILI